MKLPNGAEIGLPTDDRYVSVLDGSPNPAIARLYNNCGLFRQRSQLAYTRSMRNVNSSGLFALGAAVGQRRVVVGPRIDSVDKIPIAFSLAGRQWISKRMPYLCLRPNDTDASIRIIVLNAVPNPVLTTYGVSVRSPFK